MICGSQLRFIVPKKDEDAGILCFELFKEIGFLQRACVDKSARKPIIVTVSSKKKNVPSRFKKVMRSRLHKTEVFRKDDAFLFTDRKSAFMIYPRKSTGVLYVDRQTFSRSNYSFRQVLTGGVLELLRWRGLYPIHASGVYSQGRGILLMGDSGCGKSTVTLSLLLRGWRFLSDDLVFVRECNRRLRILSVSSSLKYNHRLFAGLQPLPISSGCAEEDEAVIDVERVFPRQSVYHCVPGIIIFLRIVDSRKSALVSIPQRLAFFKLINQSVSLFLGGKPSQGQLDVLRKLSTRTATLQLSLGHDLRRDPLAVADIISTIKGSSRR